jgi:type II secretory pathway pseudopilin PulG
MVHYSYIMKRGSGTTSRKQPWGYTIVETLIFLAVSSVMFVSVMLLVNGQQQRTEFVQAVRTFESEMQDIANDVSTGNSAYPFPAGQSCKINGGGNLIIDNSSPAGQQRCIFIGRVLQFVPQGTNPQTYNTYTIVGKQRLSVGGKEVSSLAEAKPIALVPGTGPNASVPDYKQVTKMSAAARIGKVSYKQGAVTTPVGAFGFYTTFQSYTGGSISTNSIHVDAAPVSGTALSNTTTSVADRIAAHTAASPTLTPLNPNGGITVCILSNASNQYALIQFGGNSTGNLAVTTTIETGSVCP